MYRTNILDSIIKKVKQKDTNQSYLDKKYLNQGEKLTKAINENCPRDWSREDEKEYLQKMIEKLIEEDKEVAEIFHNTPQFVISAFMEDVFKEANNLYNPNYYDFCILSSELDSIYAEQLKNVISDRFQLMGCTPNEFLKPGQNIFHAYDSMIQRSTKVLFLLTENFINDNFCIHLQSSLMWSQLLSDYSKCITVYPQGIKNMKIPLALAGLVGLNMQKPDQVDHLLKITFSEKIRHIRFDKIQQTFNEKFIYIQKVLQEKLQHLKMTKTFSIEEKMSNKVITTNLDYPMHANQLEVTSLENTKSDINAYISNSSEIHLGNNIIYNINLKI